MLLYSKSSQTETCDVETVPVAHALHWSCDVRLLYDLRDTQTVCCTAVWAAVGGGLLEENGNWRSIQTFTELKVTGHKIK